MNISVLQQQLAEARSKQNKKLFPEKKSNAVTHLETPELHHKLQHDSQNDLGSTSSTEVSFTASPCHSPSKRLPSFFFPGRPPGRCPQQQHPNVAKSFQFPGIPPGRPPPRISKSLFPGTPPGNPPGKPGAANGRFPGRPPGQCVGSKTTCAEENLSSNQQRVPPQGLMARKLQWVTVPDTRTAGSLWDALSGGETAFNSGAEIPKASKLEPNYQKLTDLFFEKSRTRKTDNLRTKTFRLNKVAPGSVQILDFKRRQNLEICLKGLGLLDNLKPLIKTVVELEPFMADKPEAKQTALSAGSLQMVIGLYPTFEEEKLLRNHLAKNPVPPLSRAESFLAELIKIRFFKSKAECCLIHFTFKEEARACQQKVEKIAACLSSIESSLSGGALRSLLGLTLSVGNYLNYGSNKGSARGFALESLALLRAVKSTDGSTNLLRYIAETISAQHSHYWVELQESIGKAQIALEVSFDDIVVLVNQLLAKINKVDHEVQQIQKSCQDEKLFVEVLGSFVKTSRAEVQEIEKKTKSVETDLKGFFKLLGVKGKTANDGLEIFRQLYRFWLELRAAHLENYNAEQKSKELLRLRAANEQRHKGTQTARISKGAAALSKFHAPLTARPFAASSRPSVGSVDEARGIPEEPSKAGLPVSDHSSRFATSSARPPDASVDTAHNKAVINAKQVDISKAVDVCHRASNVSQACNVSKAVDDVFNASNLPPRAASNVIPNKQVDLAAHKTSGSARTTAVGLKPPIRRIDEAPPHIPPLELSRISGNGVVSQNFYSSQRKAQQPLKSAERKLTPLVGSKAAVKKSGSGGSQEEKDCKARGRQPHRIISERSERANRHREKIIRKAFSYAQ